MLLIPILEKYSVLTKSEQAIADFILEDPEEALAKTAQEIAEITGTSSATVIRFSRKIGFDSLSDMKVGIAKYLHNNANVVGKDLIINKEDNYETCSNKLLAQINSVCKTTAEQIDFVNFARAIEAIEHAENIYIFGIGSSGTIAADLQQKLIRVNKKAVFYSDSHVGMLATMTFSPKDVAIAISYSGSTSIVKAFLQAAKNNDVFCISITGNNETAIAQISDIILTTPSLEQKYRIGAVSSRYSQQFICDMIFLSLIINHYDDAEILTSKASNLIARII